MTPLLAQTNYPKHNITLGAGAGLPGGDLSGFFANRPGVTVGYGYRFQRYFQADVGLDGVFGAARVRDFLSTDLGYLRIHDVQYFLPFGGRVVLPIGGGRVLASLGGGGAYLRYSERLQQASSYYRFACPSCTSRSGWGNYGSGRGQYGTRSLPALPCWPDRKSLPGAHGGRTSGRSPGYAHAGSLGEPLRRLHDQLLTKLPRS